MTPERIKKIIKKNCKPVAPNDYQKTELARKYNPETKEHDEMIDEYLRYISL